MPRKNLQVFACVLCIGGAQLVAAPPSIAADPPKNEDSVRQPLNGDDLLYSYGRMEESYEQQTKWLTDLVKATAGDSPRNKLLKFGAINLLGQMRATCAVDALMKNLMFCPGVWYDSTMHAPQEYYPSAIALVKIGNTAIPALVGHISYSPSKDERQLACWVLMKIDGGGGVYEKGDGKDFSLVRLQKAKEKGFRAEQANLSEAISYIQSFKFGTPFPEKTPEAKK